MPMQALKECLQMHGFTNVMTYIASGNIILDSDKTPQEIKNQVEVALVQDFKLDSDLIEVLVLSPQQIESVIHNKPMGFGEKPDEYHSDVIFLLDIAVDEAMSVFNPREGVDTIWPGDGVIYSQRLSALRTKSRLSRIIGTPAYQSMTIRTWSTITQLVSLLHSQSAEKR